MKPVQSLILLAHPTLEIARLNRALLDHVENIPGLQVRDLYALYPDFKIDATAEQASLRDADLIIFQFPFYWYSTPSLLKEWQDVVLTWGFAFGKQGEALHGKKLFAAVTAGSAEDMYRPNGKTQFSIEELLRPIQLTAQYCGMDYGEPFAVYGGGRVSDEEQKTQGAAYRARVLREISGRENVIQRA